MLTNKIIKLMFASLLTGCSSPSQLKASDNTMRFAQVKIGMSEAKAKEIVGAPISVAKYSDDFDWFYGGAGLGQSQHAEIVFDASSRQVKSIIVMPSETGADFQTDYLKKKFVAQDYLQMRRQKCSSAYEPNEVYYISPQQGFVIVERNFAGTSGGVKRYYWTTAKEAAELIKLLQTCPF